MRGNPADNKAFSGPSPSCMLNHNPCPLPHGWVDWALVNSTAMMARTSNTEPDTGEQNPRNFVSKPRNVVSKTRNCVLKTRKI